jgi:hypothetical protein
MKETIPYKSRAPSDHCGDNFFGQSSSHTLFRVFPSTMIFVCILCTNRAYPVKAYAR